MNSQKNSLTILLEMCHDKNLNYNFFIFVIHLILCATTNLILYP